MLEQDTGVDDGHVIDALPGLVLDDAEQIVGRQLLELLAHQDALVDRNRSDGNARRRDDRLAYAVDVAASRQVHYGIRAVLHREPELLDLLVEVGRDGRGADVGVDLDACDGADPHGLERAGQVADVGRDDQAPTGDFGLDNPAREPFPLGDELDRRGDLAAARGGHLRHAGKIDRREEKERKRTIAQHPHRRRSPAGSYSASHAKPLTRRRRCVGGPSLRTASPPEKGAYPRVARSSIPSPSASNAENEQCHSSTASSISSQR